MAGGVERGFTTPPEVVSYFADKRLRPGFSWADVWGEEHAHAFTVAKAVEAELLGTFKGSLERALRDGQGFDTWREGVKAELQRQGWWGPRTVRDPTGQDTDREVNFASTRRLRTIFWSNVNSARAAGQWERVQRTKKALPYLLYVRTSSADPRREHRRWWGLILPVDDPFWRTHFPPNGWGCKCTVRQVTKREADRLLEKGSQDGPQGRISYSNVPPQVDELPFRNRRTGEVTQVPAGIDPGWATNPGLARARTLMRRFEGVLEEAGEEVARGKVREFWRSSTPTLLAGIPERLHMPVAASTRITARLGADGPLISLSTPTMRQKILTRRRDGLRAFDVGSFALVQMLVDEGVTVDRGERGLWCVGWIGQVLWKVAFKRSAEGRAYVATLHPIDLDRLRDVPVIPTISSEGEAWPGGRDPSAGD